LQELSACADPFYLTSARLQRGLLVSDKLKQNARKHAWVKPLKMKLPQATVVRRVASWVASSVSGPRYNARERPLVSLFAGPFRDFIRLKNLGGALAFYQVRNPTKNGCNKSLCKTGFSGWIQLLCAILIFFQNQYFWRWLNS
jgi:hypothetical protein